ncbi:RagB/SusD family nutrient uptake outer membrane protein [Flavisolibacter tropicus]|uniref:Glycan metabolism protein RagB n=1 Tax=Flavisolibacter tropicus TaxID=1492898 RepID=A0A172TQ54_9BACT|nr:RagB/SusD family nutrient uptake outer membrane protein [Flavisolibacter tropicus]ANE49150.1 glycan metabolism protein RagB [Flavisolibacter tropicus]
MNFSKYLYSLLACTLLLSCGKDVLDRPPLTNYLDDQYWRNEDDVRMYANSYYPYYFSGYNTGFGVDYSPVRGYTFSDDLTGKNAQTSFESSIPASRGSSSETAAWMSSYAGPTWNFAWVRKSNILLDRLDNVVKPKLSDEAYKHWTAVGRFFRGFEYSRLVSVFGDVPYFDKLVDYSDLQTLYKDRDNRGVVMDKVYDDFKYALANMRDNDGTQYMNKYIAAAFISRFMLFEGTFQHYHGLDAARAKKYLEFAVEASEIVMNSNKYNFSKDFKSIFSSDDLAGHPEVILYRKYDAALNITHAIGSYSNGTEVVGVDPNLVLIKSFIANDGNVWQNSTVTNAKSFAIADLVKTRDPRFEASFIDKPLAASATLLYGYKFASREAITYINKTYPPAWGSNTNTSDAPIIRLAEVVLNWIEAKAVLAQYFGSAAVSQTDLNKSINAIRNRPLDGDAISKGVQKTAPLQLAAIPNDPARDADVPALIWEIRRERRMEFVFEHTRLLDLKRWKKLSYMNFSSNPDYLLGPWVNVQAEIPSYLTTANKGKIRVKKDDGTIVTWDGTNASAMVGFWMVESAANRNAFTDRVYLSPVGQSQIVQYKEKGFNLTQTTGW